MDNGVVFDSSRRRHRKGRTHFEEYIGPSKKANETMAMHLAQGSTISSREHLDLKCFFNCSHHVSMRPWDSNVGIDDVSILLSLNYVRVWIGDPLGVLSSKVLSKAKRPKQNTAFRYRWKWKSQALASKGILLDKSFRQDFYHYFKSHNFALRNIFFIGK